MRLLDASPICDGCCAVLLSDRHRPSRRRSVRIAASAAASQEVAIDRKDDLLRMRAIEHSTRKALSMARIRRADVDLFEPHDAYTIMTALSLESAGFAAPGQALAFARAGGIGIEGAVPICTMGGLKARGHAVGATGVYQIAEAYQQLLERAGQNQVKNADVCLTQNVGGCGTSATTHVIMGD